MFGQGNNLTCEFGQSDVSSNGVNGPEVSVYTCALKPFLDDITNQSVDVDTTENSETNDDVKAVEVLGHSSATVVKFIPFSIFKVFPFLEYFILIDNSVELEELKPGFFTGAVNLRVLRIEHTSVSELTSNLFEESKALEFINLSNNNINKIDKDAFSNLKNLQLLSLDYNNIEYLHPKTFSNLEKLESLNLIGNTCIDQVFHIINGDFRAVEDAIWKKCKCISKDCPAPPLPSEITDDKKTNDLHQLTDAQFQSINATMHIHDVLINNLDSKMTILQKTFNDSDSKKVKEIEDLIKNNEKWAKQQITELSEEVTEIVQDSERYRSDVSEKLESTKINLLNKLGENFNSTQEKFVKLNNIVETIQNDCCKDTSSNGEINNSQRLEFLIKSVEFKINNELKKVKEDNRFLLERVDLLEARFRDEGENNK